MLILALYADPSPQIMHGVQEDIRRTLDRKKTAKMNGTWNIYLDTGNKLNPLIRRSDKLTNAFVNPEEN